MPIRKQHEKSEKPVSFNGYTRILCADLRDFWTRIKGVLPKDLFWTKRPAGGAITGPCENMLEEVHGAPRE